MKEKPKRSYRERRKEAETNGRRSPSSIARDIVKEFGISRKTRNVQIITETINKLISDGEIGRRDGQSYVSNSAETQFLNLAKELEKDILVENSPEAASAYKDIKGRLNRYKYYLSKEDRKEITDFRAYSRSSENQINFTLDRKNMSVDKLYSDLVRGEYGYLFPGNATHPGEMAREINDVVGFLKESSKGTSMENVYGREVKEREIARLYATLEVYTYRWLDNN